MENCSMFIPELDWDPAILSPMELLATNFTLLSMLSRESKTQIAGVVVVANAKMRFLQFRCVLCVHFTTGITSELCRYFGVQQIRCVAALLNGAVPLWFRKFHIVNHHRYNMFSLGLVHTILGLIRQGFQYFLWFAPTLPEPEDTGQHCLSQVRKSAK